MKPAGDDETTGLPGLRTWPQVYVAVIVIFLAWVGLLAALAGLFA